MWKGKVLNKVKVFGWHFILNSFSSKVELLKRCVIRDITLLLCLVCSLLDKDLNNLFFSCDGAKRVWETMISWLGGDITSFGSIDAEHSFVNRDCGRLSSFVQPSYSMFLWLLVSWCIWWSRNNLIFCYKSWIVMDILSCIKSFG